MDWELVQRFQNLSNVILFKYTSKKPSSCIMYHLQMFQWCLMPKSRELQWSSLVEIKACITLSKFLKERNYFTLAWTLRWKKKWS